MSENPTQETPPQVGLADKLKARVDEALDSANIDRDKLRVFAGRPLQRDTWSATLYLLTTFLSAIVAAVLLSVMGLLLITIIGIPLLVPMFWISHRYIRLERARLEIVDSRELDAVDPQHEGKLMERAAAYLGDVQTWKDIGWLAFMTFVAFPLAGLALAGWLIAAGWIVYPLWGWAMPGDATPIGFITGDDVSFWDTWLVIPLGFLMAILTSWVCTGLSLGLAAVHRLALEETDEQRLRGRVTELERGREETRIQQSSELSRIERDLHDGAQARLVALAMELGMAEKKFEDDPQAALELVANARSEAQTTLQELRDLVRGIGPQILRDRGLQAGLEPLVARSPIATELEVDLPTRPPEPVETASYFFAAEALANAIKHSGASSLSIRAWEHEQWVYLRVSDNGEGGADEQGSGLRGLRARIEALDGKMMVSSPSGGPTIIDAWLPMN